MTAPATNYIPSETRSCTQRDGECAARIQFALVATIVDAFGLAVQAARSRRRWRQEDLAKAAGLHRAYISRVERGVTAPSLPTQERLAKALGVPLAELVADAERERERYRRSGTGRGQ